MLQLVEELCQVTNEEPRPLTREEVKNLVMFILDCGGKKGQWRERERERER